MTTRRILACLLSMMIILMPISAFAEDTNNDETLDTSTWTTEDFTYEEYEKLLYGCDYSRQITITGKVVSGFSEQGEQKLEANKDLVIPAKDDEGNQIVGVGQEAFKGKGLTSVKFPTGMLVEYEDDNANTKGTEYEVTRRGNFIIAEEAFMNNNLTEVNLPTGVIAVLANAFQSNQLTTVTLPKTIWWIETVSFAKNEITTVNFPKTTDFSLEMHGMAFAFNRIQSVRLPDFTEVVNKFIFAYNPGMESVAEKDADSITPDSKYDYGVVYMYTDNADLMDKNRIHTNARTVASQYSNCQKLILRESGDGDTGDTEWTASDFTYDGNNVITGLSESGETKRSVNKDLHIPNKTPDGATVTEIGSTTSGTGLFSTEDEKFDSVFLPNTITKIGERAFYNSGIEEVTYSNNLREIGDLAFSTNNLTSIVLPDSVTTLGSGAFSTNPKLERIVLSKNLTEIPGGAFGCSDAKNYMTNLTSINIPEGITSIGVNAFAGNNFHEIVIPSTVKTIGRFAFSTKNYLDDPCTLILPEGLETIGADAFRNKVIEEVNLPTTVTALPATAFRKEYSSNGASNPGHTGGIVTKVYVSTLEQYQDKENFPDSDFHKIYLNSDEFWTSEDFTYETIATNEATKAADPEAPTSIRVISGFSNQGLLKLAANTELVIPAEDNQGTDVDGIGASAFAESTITSVSLPESVWYIGEAAFSKNSIGTAEFPASTTRPLQLEARSFAENDLIAVQLPENTGRIDALAFVGNTGRGEITDGTEEEQSGGVVTVYIPNASDEMLEALQGEGSKVNNLVSGPMSAVDAPWGTRHFTFDGTTVTGLSEDGYEKLLASDEAINLIVPTKNENDDYVTAIGADAFRGLNFASVVIPKLVTEIGDGAFAAEENGSEVTEVSLPMSLRSIGDEAFQNHPLTELEIPSTVETIGARAFQNNEISSLDIPDSVISIGEGAFEQSGSGKGKLMLLSIGTGITEIPSKAFAGSGLYSIELPSTVVSLARDAFNDPKGILSTVYLKTSNQNQVDGVGEYENIVTVGNGHEVTYDKLAGTGWEYKDFLYSEDGTTILGWSESGQEKRMSNHNLVLPDKPSEYSRINITAIGDGAFQIPESEITIRKFDCLSPNGIQQVSFPMHLQSIGDKAFEYNNLWNHNSKGEKVEMPVDEDAPDTEMTDDTNRFLEECTELTHIGESAFHGNHLVSVSIPDSVTSMGNGAFAMNNIYELKLSENMTVIPQGAFSMNIRMSKITIPNKVTEIGDMAFAGARLETLTIPKSVTKIGRKAFHLHRLKSLVIPGNVKEVGESAFEGTYKAITLKTLVIEDGVESIGTRAFKEAHLTEVSLPASVQYIGTEPFENNDGKEGYGEHVVLVKAASKELLKYNENAKYFVIKVGLENATVSGIKSKTYTGKALTQSAKLTLAGEALQSGTDYTVKYSNNKAVGTATVTYTGKGDCVGTVKKTFSILPKGTSIKKVTAGKKKFTVKWTKQATQTTGYQIRYSTSSKFTKAATKTVTVKGGTKTSYTKKSLKAKKKYYVQIRTYKKVGSKTYYSSWSKTKAVKTK